MPSHVHDGHVLGAREGGLRLHAHTHSFYIFSNIDFAKNGQRQVDLSK